MERERVTRQILPHAAARQRGLDGVDPLRAQADRGWIQVCTTANVIAIHLTTVSKHAAPTSPHAMATM